jgi:hypothetical protein
MTEITVKGIIGEMRAENRRLDRTWLRKVPASAEVVPEGRVVVHNPVMPARNLGERGFRAWTQIPDDKIEICPCEWEPKLGKHYRIKPDPKGAQLDTMIRAFKAAVLDLGPKRDDGAILVDMPLEALTLTIAAIGVQSQCADIQGGAFAKEMAAEIERHISMFIDGWVWEPFGLGVKLRRSIKQVAVPADA